MFSRIITTTADHSFFLFGARGTGKTTFIKHQFHSKTLLYIDLLQPDVEDMYIRNPETLEHQVRALSDKSNWIVIDEIQKAPRLLDVVHRLIETTTNKFILSGSSERKLKRGASNLLAGRAFVYMLYPLNHAELGGSFILEQVMQYGSLPKIFSLPKEEDKQAYLRAYSLTYIKEEIIAEQILRKLEPFRDFLEVAAQSNGKIINFSKIARDVGVDTKTVISYYSILQDTNIGTILPPFNRSIRKQQRSNPKFYFFDIGVKRALDRTLTLPLVPGTYEYGNAFEHFIINEILRLGGYQKPDWRFSYLRTAGGAEIDLIIDRPGLSTVLVEIKSSTVIEKSDIKTLASFYSDFDHPLALCLSRDPVKKIIEQVLCIHWREGIKELFE